MVLNDPVVDEKDMERTMVLGPALADLRALVGYLDESAWRYKQSGM